MLKQGITQKNLLNMNKKINIPQTSTNSDTKGGIVKNGQVPTMHNPPPPPPKNNNTRG